MIAKSLQKVYQIKVTLKGSRPPIWRRLLVPSSVTLDKFHVLLQITMGWSNYHLHLFVVNGQSYGEPGPHLDLEVMSEQKFRLDQILQREKDSMVYEYDFGDGWEHKIVLEKLLPYDSKMTLPICIKGKRACPPEDVGGSWGYYEFLLAIGDPSHPEHEEYVEWIGGEFDPERFDIDDINAMLAQCFKRGPSGRP